VRAGGGLSVPDAVSYCLRPAHLRRTIGIAIVVGLILTAVNQLQVILDGRVTLATWLRCGANFLIPFVVSNLGLLSGRRGEAPGAGR
jgi:hypothetical protein